jgi:pyruvate dehydrogenase E2 component (dihydrolipoamide acetyltransferase)
VRDVAGKPLGEVHRELKELAQRAVDGKSQPGDLDGATFTITNLGALGVDAFTPIINLPQVAILGVGRIQQKPAAWQNRIELRDRMILSLTFDHRLVDGAPAARFLRRIAELLEGPSWIELRAA